MELLKLRRFFCGSVYKKRGGPFFIFERKPFNPSPRRQNFRLLQMKTKFGLHFNPVPNDKFYTFPIRKSLQTTISNLLKKAESSQNG